MPENPPTDDQPQSDAARAFWDAEAATFDNEPDHGLRDPAIRAAWSALLTDQLPPNASPAPLRILDVGCGTGSLSLILAEQGYTVTGVDFAPAMIEAARQKAAKQPIEFHVMDAAQPDFPAQQFDVLVCRHVLWALPEPADVLKRWRDLLKPGGTLLLIEGYWHTGAGLHAADVVQMLPESMTAPVVTQLSDHAALWGRAVSDERYAIRARRID